jgi:hypothetical protein
MKRCRGKIVNLRRSPKALVAAPAGYGVTGVKTFMISDDGIVYEKDLGRKPSRHSKR